MGYDLPTSFYSALGARGSLGLLSVFFTEMKAFLLVSEFDTAAHALSPFPPRFGAEKMTISKIVLKKNASVRNEKQRSKSSRSLKLPMTLWVFVCKLCEQAIAKPFIKYFILFFVARLCEGIFKSLSVPSYPSLKYKKLQLKLSFIFYPVVQRKRAYIFDFFCELYW